MKAAAKKKPAAKKKAVAKKKIAVNAKSRATGKPPGARLKKRSAANTVAGAYPNPARQKTGTGWGNKEYLVFAALAGNRVNPVIYYLAEDGRKLVTSRIDAIKYARQSEAKKAAVKLANDGAIARSDFIVGVANSNSNSNTISKELRATGKPPSARLKKRRAANKVAGAYPNPAKRKGYKAFGHVAGIVYFVTSRGTLSSRPTEAEIFTTTERALTQAKKIAHTPGFKAARIGVATAGESVAAIKRYIAGKK